MKGLLLREERERGGEGKGEGKEKGGVGREEGREEEAFLVMWPSRLSALKSAPDNNVQRDASCAARCIPPHSR